MGEDGEDNMGAPVWKWGILYLQEGSVVCMWRKKNRMIINFEDVKKYKPQKNNVQ